MDLEEDLLVIGGERQRQKVIDPLNMIGENPVFLNLDKKEESYLVSILKLPYTLLKHSEFRQKNILIEQVTEPAMISFILTKLCGNKTILRLRGDEKNAAKEQAIFSGKRINLFSFLKQFRRFMLTKINLKLINEYILVSESLEKKVSAQKRKYAVNTPYLDKSKGNSHKHRERSKKIVSVTNFSFPSKVEATRDFILDNLEWIEEEDLELVIAGNGLLLEEFRDEFSNCNFITFPGYLDNLENTYREADIFIHFSYMDAYPSVVLEAQAAKLPVVVNDCCGMKEQVEEGETGLIVDLDNKEETKNKIENLIDDRDLRERLGQNGHHKVMRENSKEKIGRDLEEAIEELSQETT